MRSCESSPSTAGISETTTLPTHLASTTDVGDQTNSTGDDSGSDDTGGGADSGSGARSRLNQRRTIRAERRYRTADTIHDLDKRSSEHDNAIHKRLSLNCGGAKTCLAAAAVGDCSLRLPECSSTTLSCESLGSFPSSSGVSSTASLCRINDDDVSGDVDPTPTTTTKIPSQDDDMQDTETTDEPTDRSGGGSQYQTACKSDDSLTAAHRLQFLVAERRRLNQELLFMNPALEAS